MVLDVKSIRQNAQIIQPRMLAQLLHKVNVTKMVLIVFVFLIVL